MRWLQTLLENVTGFDDFPTVARGDAMMARLQADYPETVKLDTIGASRAGHPLQMVSIGTGSRHAVVFGMVHPNEPTGTLAQLRLIELLARDRRLRDRLGLQWHFLPCMDPDGARLNEGWFAGPFDRPTYAQHLYRPPFDEQFEWTFHRPDLSAPGLEPTPESLAAMGIIDTFRPELVVSMHNAEVGGVYCYTTDLLPDLAPGLELVRRVSGVPYDLGEPEEPADRIGPAIFHVPANLAGGKMLCSTDYAAQYGAVGLTLEPPLWVDSRCEDQSELPYSRAEIGVRISADREGLADRHAHWVAAIAEEFDLTSTARGRAVLANDTQAMFEDHPLRSEESQPATVAYTSSLRRGLDLERLRSAGQVIALLETINSHAPKNPVLELVVKDAQDALDSWVAETATLSLPFVGLRGAPQCHIGLTLAAAEGLKDT